MAHRVWDEIDRQAEAEGKAIRFGPKGKRIKFKKSRAPNRTKISTHKQIAKERQRRQEKEAARIRANKFFPNVTEENKAD